MHNTDSIHLHYILAKSQYIQYILCYIFNTAISTSCNFSIHVSTSPSTSLDTSWRDSIHTRTSFNTSCHENNTSDTFFNTLQYIVPVFNTSDVLEDVLDVLTSNTSFHTSQYILQIFGYIPIHHPSSSIHSPRLGFANELLVGLL
jgi:hypothetical protein